MSFNLRKIAQPMREPAGTDQVSLQDPSAVGITSPVDGTPAGQPQGQLSGGDELNGQKFTTDSLMAWIEQNKENPEVVRNSLSRWMTDQPLLDKQTNQPYEAADVLNLDAYYASPDKGAIADKILKLLPPNMRENTMNDENSIQTKEQMPNNEILEAVQKSNEAIKKLAQDLAKKNSVKTAGTYNLRKTAQSRALQQYMLFGPESTQFAPSVNQIMNNYHVTERNKGWGLRVDEMYGIDYETFWRNNVMDKFYREYRDKDGNWVGGYLRKRFETDSNVPETNKYQLKPGELRKPYLPEYGSTEARLETARGNKVFNWREASSRLVIKTADVKKK